jgi:hypothetical protein
MGGVLAHIVRELTREFVNQVVDFFTVRGAASTGEGID